MRPLLDSIAGGSFTAVKARLDALGGSPPQVLLLEGGSEEQRLDTARYWACRCKCPTAAETGTPCLSCPTCRQLVAHENLDLLAFDGRISNAEDDASPGAAIRALSVENIRALKSTLKDPPHSPGPRVVVLMGIDGRRASAANALLKALEEPSPTSIFVLLAMQREQVLPTLVSRSFCVTLPWPDPEADGDSRADTAALAAFLHSGQRLFDITGAKGFALTDAQELLLAFQKALLRVCGQASPAAPGSPEKELETLTPAQRLQVSRWLNETQETLAAGVTPARAVEGFAASVYTLLHAK